MYQAYRSNKPISSERSWLPYVGKTKLEVKQQVRENETYWQDIFIAEREIHYVLYYLEPDLKVGEYDHRRVEYFEKKDQMIGRLLELTHEDHICLYACWNELSPA